MNVLVVYESMYGNTGQVAEAIGEGLSGLGNVSVKTSQHVTPKEIADARLLVVGGPTHMHSLPNRRSRRAAVEAAAKDSDLDAEEDALGPGLREWIKRLPITRAYGAAFDTRLDRPVLLTGSAAKIIERRLGRHGYTPLLKAESFLVQDSPGPLGLEELDRARAWGVELATSGRAALVTDEGNRPQARKVT